MKKLIVIWTILALTLELGGLYIVNKFVFINSSDFESTEIIKTPIDSNNISATIDEDASNVTLSYNGKYIAYLLKNNLCVEDAKLGNVNEFNLDTNEVIMYYTWLEKRDLIAIIEKVSKEGNEKIQLIVYNPSNNSKSFVQEICDYSENMKIDNMTTSVLTNVYYININKGGSKNTVYRIDRNNTLSKVNIRAKILGNIKVIPHEDRLIYEDKSNDKFYITNPDEELILNSNKNLKILGINSSDVIYIGELNGNKIVSIMYGKINENPADWQNIVLESPVGINDFYFKDNGDIVINNRLKGTIYNLSTKTELNYTGDLIQLKEDFFATINNDRKLTYTNYEE